LDEEFREHSERLFADFEAERLQAVVSNITIAEILEAAEQVQALLDRPALQKTQTVYLDEEAVSLAEAYIKEGVVGSGQSNRRSAHRHCHCPESRYIGELEFPAHSEMEPNPRL